MDRIVYDALTKYYENLGKLGYAPKEETNKLLVLTFYKDFVFQDFRGKLSKEDYRSIESALECLYGTTCLIPYPDYLKMGKLYLGSMTEMAQRVKTVEDTSVLKIIPNPEETEAVDSDIDVVMVEESSEQG